MKSIFTLLIIASSVFATTAQQKAYQYFYDDAGNRYHRNVIYLPPMAPGGGGSQAFVEPSINDGEGSKKKNEVQSVIGEGLEITLYPNPVTSSVNVEFTNPEMHTHEVRIIDGNGKIVFSKAHLDGNFSVPFEGYEAGAYFIWLRFGEKVKRYQVIKQ